MLYYLFKYIVLPFYLLIRMPRIIGYKNTSAILKGKAIIISNHRSMLDPLLLALCMPRFIHFMAKEELFEKKLLALLIKSLLAFPVSRKAGDIKSMKTALELLDKGKCFGIFPEGKRAVTDDVDEFEKGAAFFAIKTDAPILPVYIPKNNYRLFKRPRLYIGEAIRPEEYNASGAKSAAIRKLNAMFEERIDELRVSAGD